MTSNWSYSYSEEMVVPSIEAKDGAFFVVDQALHLVIAHRGNYTLNTRISESILIKLFSKAVQPHFEIIQGYKGGIRTRTAVSILWFSLIQELKMMESKF